MKLLFAAVFALFALSTFDQVDSSAYDKIVSHSRIRAKKEGPNVCALQHVLGTKKKYFSTCRNWYQGTICGKKATVVYECCPGYMKLDGMRGCPAVAPIDHVYGTLDLVNAITTQQYSALSKLREEIEGPGSYTFFAPSNEAWDLLDTEVRGALVSNVNIELYNALHYHMANKRLLTKDLKNGLTVKSMYNDLTLFINHYPNGVVTVNCARIIHGNQVATNGVVHVIDRVITAVSNTIQDVLEVEDDLSSLNTVASNAGLLEKLGKPGHFTLFAPTNDAFSKLDNEVMDRLMGNKGALQALFNYHLLDSVQCSEAIMSGTAYETVEGSNIEIGCDGDSLTVNGVQMVLKKDIVTSNGVIHLIDQVLMPDSAKQVLELVGQSQSTFGDMVSELGLTAAMRPKAEYTLLAPINAAFSDEVMSMDQSILRVILENHILKKKIVLSQLFNGQRLETLGGKFLRVFIYRTAVCIENACLIRGSKEGTNGALHLMKTLIKPAESNMFQLLTEHGGFKIFLSLMEAAGLTDLLKQEGDFTLFAPSDEALAGLTEREISILKRDPNALRTILLYHFSKGIFIGGGLESGVTNLLKSLQGSYLKVLFGNDGVRVNSVQVPKSDLMASNGVIHISKSLLYPEDVPVGNQEFLSLLRRFIKYIQIKYVSGYRFQEIPLTFMKRVITVPEVTKVTRVVQGQPSVTTVTRVIEGAPSVTKVTRVIEGDPSLTHVTRVIEGDPTFTKVTRVIEGEPSLTHVTRVIEGDPTFTKVTRVIEGEPSLTKVTRVIEGPEILFSSFADTEHNGPQTEFFNLETDVEKITQVVQDGRRVPGRRVPAGVRRRTRMTSQPKTK
ncbi:periostin, osteoblast specific factor b isoform X1 [Ictalurus punctatus]|uniref:Periostin, osteoblast specific factor b isoform X1 n=1 Tax=Ictalurus punctatus TaxID=7998 RepID=A0A2D0SUH9_ICTPU|nr:periostin, osteoblast specific factor b isoform X1 [Ictalurus punctatus]